MPWIYHQATRQPYHDDLLVTDQGYAGGKTLAESTRISESRRNEGLIDLAKVQDDSGKAQLLAVENIGKNQLESYIHLVTFPAKASAEIQAIVAGGSSATECSETGVDVYGVDVYIVAKAIDGGA